MITSRNRIPLAVSSVTRILHTNLKTPSRHAITEESGRRDVQTTEIETIRSKLVLVEERSQHFLSTLVSLRAAVDDEAERSANWAAQFKHDLANVQLALQVMIYEDVKLINTINK